MSPGHNGDGIQEPKQQRQYDVTTTQSGAQSSWEYLEQRKKNIEEEWLVKRWTVRSCSRLPMTLLGSHLHNWAVCVSVCLSVCVCQCGNNVNSFCLVSGGLLEHLHHLDFSLGFQCSPPSLLPSSSAVKILSLEHSVAWFVHISATDCRIVQSTHHTHIRQTSLLCSHYCCVNGLGYPL